MLTQPSVVGLTGTNDALIGVDPGCVSIQAIYFLFIDVSGIGQLAYMIGGSTSLDINPTYFPISDIIWMLAYMFNTEHLQ